MATKRSSRRDELARERGFRTYRQYRYQDELLRRNPTAFSLAIGTAMFDRADNPVWIRAVKDYYNGFISKDAKKRDRIRSDKTNAIRAQMDWYNYFDISPATVRDIYNNGSYDSFVVMNDPFLEDAE